MKPARLPLTVLVLLACPEIARADAVARDGRGDVPADASFRLGPNVGLGSTTSGSGLSLGFDVLLRIHHVTAGGFAQSTRADGGWASAYGATVGPSLPAGPLDLDLLLTAGVRDYAGVGAFDDGELLGPGCRSSGASAKMALGGARVGVAKRTYHGAQLAWGAWLYWNHDLGSRDVATTTTCHSGAFRPLLIEPTTVDHRRLGGDEVGVSFRLAFGGGFAL